jgi:hypothetical protein
VRYCRLFASGHIGTHYARPHTVILTVPDNRFGFDPTQALPTPTWQISVFNIVRLDWPFCRETAPLWRTLSTAEIFPGTPVNIAGINVGPSRSPTQKVL